MAHPRTSCNPPVHKYQRDPVMHSKGSDGESRRMNHEQAPRLATAPPPPTIAHWRKNMNDQESPAAPVWTPDEMTSPANDASPAPTKVRSRRRTAGAAILGSLLVGGAAGAAFFGPLTAAAATPTSTLSQPAAGGYSQGGHDGGFGGRNETVSDASVVAKAIGISETNLTTALQGGQTVAQVAKAHNVSTQTVIDALVTDGLNELAAEVKAGTITQAQADAQKAAVTQRATGQVNGTLMGGPGGPGHDGGFGNHG
jgi:hypothetical protein